MARRENVVRSHCNTCARDNKHRVLKKKDVSTVTEIEELEMVLEYFDSYEMLECAGCTTVSLRHTSTDPDGDVKIVMYPPRVARRRPSWFHKIPAELWPLLKQVYVALDSDCKILALMGVRAVLDIVMVAHVSDVGTFKEKLDALEKTGVIAGQQRVVLEAVVDAGSAAAHRGYRPTTEHINAVMEILENLLQAVYHLPRIADALAKGTPPRPKRMKKQGSKPAAAAIGASVSVPLAKTSRE